ncbi:hypothetical protein M8542_23590 [Amycolatopsis sp. OK19-0408]|uniref:Uncharacterized protein n=1 Tax=Amycolatopsis iheyensis TaxID=2945988 RepID=A0A9X2SL42_9PSEU|nr:hypothetical protein [Amycolatopsis iheyensis]MCR6485813.1 hypothetical protein [Amycolatopsis iheyensis]
MLATAAPAEAAGLARDPVAVVYDRDHALHVLNGGATDDELTLRTLASSAWACRRSATATAANSRSRRTPPRAATCG